MITKKSKRQNSFLYRNRKIPVSILLAFLDLVSYSDRDQDRTGDEQIDPPGHIAPDAVDDVDGHAEHADGAEDEESLISAEISAKKDKETDHAEQDQTEP